MNAEQKTHVHRPAKPSADSRPISRTTEEIQFFDKPSDVPIGCAVASWAIVVLAIALAVIMAVGLLYAMLNPVT